MKVLKAFLAWQPSHKSTLEATRKMAERSLQKKKPAGLPMEPPRAEFLKKQVHFYNQERRLMTSLNGGILYEKTAFNAVASLVRAEQKPEDARPEDKPNKVTTRIAYISYALLMSSFLGRACLLVSKHVTFFARTHAIASRHCMLEQRRNRPLNAKQNARAGCSTNSCS